MYAVYPELFKIICFRWFGIYVYIGKTKKYGRKALKKKNIAKTVMFMVIGTVLFGISNFFYQPVWKSWNNYDTTRGFYEEPGNTIETIFLGASTTVNGIIPTELYRDYGICAYNLGTEEQPMLASYYWMLETERLHKNTLKTVVLDVSMMRRTPGAAAYQKALDGMKFSSTKIQAVSDYSDKAEDILTYLFPVLEYHTRWDALDITDFQKKDYKVKLSTRGYNFDEGSVIDDWLAEQMAVSDYYVDESVEATELDKESLYYLEKMIKYCEDNNLKLVLMKTPAISVWNMENHNAISEIANKYQLDFFDFNYEPYIEEVQYNEATDNKDWTHLNYYGARKLTNWFGGYLLSECGNADNRNSAKYRYMQTELKDYETYISQIMELKESVDVTGYLQNALKDADNVIFLTVKDEASVALEDTQREYLKEIGLKKLATIDLQDSYIGIIDSEGVAYEKIDHVAEHSELQAESNNSMDNLNLKKIKKEKNKKAENEKELTYYYDISKKTNVELKSGGYLFGDISSCIINGEEYSANMRGINIVVYNKREDKVINSRTFDTNSYSQELGWNLEDELADALAAGIPYEELPDALQKLYLYNERCAEKKQPEGEMDSEESTGSTEPEEYTEPEE